MALVIAFAAWASCFLSENLEMSMATLFPARPACGERCHPEDVVRPAANILDAFHPVGDVLDRGPECRRKGDGNLESADEPFLRARPFGDVHKDTVRQGL